MPTEQPFVTVASTVTLKMAVISVAVAFVVGIVLGAWIF